MACKSWAFLQLFALAKSVCAAGLTSLPADVAAQASAAAFNYAWYATNSRMGPAGDVSKNKLAAEDAIAEMKTLGKGLFAESVVEEFRWLAFNVGWCAANRRNGLTTGNQALLHQANQNEHNFYDHASNLAKAGVFDDELVTNLQWMSWRASWYAANTRDTHEPEDAEDDLTWYHWFAQKISGEVTLLSIDFDVQVAKIAAQVPMVVGEQVLDNSKSGTTESMSFQYSYSEGHSDSWSNTVGFKVGIAVKTQVGFDIKVLKAGVEQTVSFEGSFEHTWAGGRSEGETKTYTYPLVVPPYKTYEAKATVDQATMDVPYTMKMSIGSYVWTTTGMWSGAAVSNSQYAVIDVTPNATADDTLASNISHASHASAVLV